MEYSNINLKLKIKSGKHIMAIFDCFYTFSLACRTLPILYLWISYRFLTMIYLLDDVIARYCVGIIGYDVFTRISYGLWLTGESLINRFDIICQNRKFAKLYIIIYEYKRGVCMIIYTTLRCRRNFFPLLGNVIVNLCIKLRLSSWVIQKRRCTQYLQHKTERVRARHKTNSSTCAFVFYGR